MERNPGCEFQCEKPHRGTCEKLRCFLSDFTDEKPPKKFTRNSQENHIEIHTKFTLEFTYPTTSFHMEFTSGFTENSLSKFTLPDLSIHLEL